MFFFQLFSFNLIAEFWEMLCHALDVAKEARRDCNGQTWSNTAERKNTFCVNGL